MIYTLTDELTNILTRSLQFWFANHPLAQEYRWHQNHDLTRIGIYDQYPDEPRRFPSIVVKGMVGASEESGFGQAAGPLIVNGETVGEAFAGWYNPRAEFQVESTHDADTRRVSDLLFTAIVRTLLHAVPRDTNGNVLFQTPEVFRSNGRGTRTDTNNRVIHYMSMTSSFKVMWHDQRELVDELLAVKSHVTITDC